MVLPAYYFWPSSFCHLPADRGAALRKGHFVDDNSHKEREAGIQAPDTLSHVQNLPADNTSAKISLGLNELSRSFQNPKSYANPKAVYE